jgi:hypothetical protein
MQEKDAGCELLWLTNAECLVVVAQNGPRDGQKRRILAAVNEAIATVLQMDVVNPNVGAVILQDS